MTNHTLADIATLGSLVRERRRALGMRQADLAMVANVGVRFIVDVENGKETCQIGRLMRLLSALDIRLTASMPSAPERRPSFEQDDELGGLDL